MMRGFPDAILFACTMNEVRSPMAAGLMRHMAGRPVHIDSAGVKAGAIDSLAVEVMQEIGIALAEHQPRSFEELDNGFYDLVIALSPQAHARALEASGTAQVEYWPIQDPTTVDGNREQRLAAYRAARDEILKKLKTRFQLAPV